MTIVHHVQLFHNVSRAHYWYKVLFLTYFFPLLREAKYYTQPAGKQRCQVSNLNTFPLRPFNYDVFSFPALASRNLWFLVGLKYFILFCLNIGVLYRKMERSSTNTKNYKPPLSNINLFERPDTDFERAKGIVSWPAEFLVVNFVFYLYLFIIILHYCLCYFVMPTLVARVFVNTVYNVFHPRYFEKRPLEPRLV